METYIKNVVQWAHERRLDGSEINNIRRQQLKLLEEVGETAEAVNKKNLEDFIDGIGDTAVVLIILTLQNNPRFLQNVNLSYLKTAQDNQNSTIKFKELTTVKVNEICSYLYSIVKVAYPCPNSKSLQRSLKFLDLIANEIGTSLLNCLAEAYDTIKNRTGKTVDGVFIKTADKKGA